jgi:hypothetical protein
MIEKLWLYPPIAIARLGSSQTPCDSFVWGANDLRPRGTGQTTVQGVTTLHVAEDGTVTSSLPTSIQFKDDAGFRPVCPFFELHGEWRTETGVETGAITPSVLAKFGLTVNDLHWKVEVANLKPHHYTLEQSDRIAATVEIAGNITQRQFLLGISPQNTPHPLVIADKPLPLGSVQLTHPSDEFPEIRLRFTPPKGLVYAPTNLKQRLEDLKQRLNGGSTIWQNFELPPEQLIINPDAKWCDFTPTPDDPRTNPGELYAFEDDKTNNGKSLGLIDDVCDGIISCSLGGVSTATARIVVAPPDFAPDRRSPVSLADGLSDRIKRDDVLHPSYVDDLNLTAAEIGDLLERVLETMEAMNLDFQNLRAHRTNRSIASSESVPPEVGENKAFPPMESLLERPLPLTEYGRQRHRRFISLEVFEDMLRERPELISKWIREPMTDEKYYDQKMPALMRGSDRYPMHLTRRQYQLLVAWANRLRKDAEAGT